MRWNLNEKQSTINSINAIKTKELGLINKLLSFKKTINGLALNDPRGEYKLDLSYMSDCLNAIDEKNEQFNDLINQSINGVNETYNRIIDNELKTIAEIEADLNKDFLRPGTNVYIVGRYYWSDGCIKEKTWDANHKLYYKTDEDKVIKRNVKVAGAKKGEELELVATFNNLIDLSGKTLKSSDKNDYYFSVNDFFIYKPKTKKEKTTWEKTVDTVKKIKEVLTSPLIESEDEYNKRVTSNLKNKDESYNPLTKVESIKTLVRKNGTKTIQNNKVETKSDKKDTNDSKNEMKDKKKNNSNVSCNEEDKKLQQIDNDLGKKSDNENLEEELKTEKTNIGQTNVGQAKAGQTRTEQPSLTQTRAEQPTLEQTKTEQQQAEQSKTENSPVEKPPVEEPPVEEPSVEDPYVEDPYVEDPSVEDPSVEDPYVEDPSVEEPSVEDPYVEEPYVEEPPVEEPPVEEPSVEEPYVEEPPVEEPYVEEQNYGENEYVETISNEDANEDLIDYTEEDNLSDE